ncbi:hypothetical protein [Spirosoma profusum]|nr:hypothetical protein [Spirosoma profusum]
MSKHTNFILTPNSEILKEFVSANKGIGNGIETYSLSEYTFQSVFLKLTGAQEQKMKCICWELATDDYEYRYERYTKSRLGECSDYKEKNTIYKDLISAIKKLQHDFDHAAYFDRQAISQQTIAEITNLFAGSNLSTWAELAYLEFTQNNQVLPHNQFASANLFENVLQERYELLYRHRNRCAHNTLSYQENLPTFKNLYNSDHNYDNYFVRFALLILIDKIVIKLFQKYEALLAEN